MSDTVDRVDSVPSTPSSDVPSVVYFGVGDALCWRFVEVSWEFSLDELRGESQ